MATRTGTKPIRGVTFERTAHGFAAQGLEIVEEIDDDTGATRWTVTLPGGGGRSDSKGPGPEVLVGWLIEHGHLKKDGES